MVVQPFSLRLGARFVVPDSIEVPCGRTFVFFWGSVPFLGENNVKLNQFPDFKLVSPHMKPKMKSEERLAACTILLFIIVVW